MRAILVPVDFSEVTDAVVEWAAGIARTAGGRLWLLHVAAPDPDFVGFEAGPDVVREQRASELRQEHRDLQVLADALRARGLDATALLVKGPTVKKILAEAERLGADLIVMGSHGRGALSRALLGSVSEGVVRGAHRPITILPGRKE